MKFNKKIKTIFLDSHSKLKVMDEKVNIVLSPSLYWVKKLSLPVKYIRDAKKLLPSIFEDTISDGNYSYYVYKKDDYFYAFAYEDKVILDVIKEKGIAPHNIANVYFAQSELQNIESALKIDETQSIVLQDDIVILLPCCWVQESAELDVTHLQHTKHSIVLAQYNHIVDKNSLYKVGAILVASIFLIFGEFFITSQKVEQTTTTQEELFEKYKLKPTMFQNKSLLKKYTKLHKKQMQLRYYTSQILALKLKGNDKLNSMILKDKKFIVSFSGVKRDEKSYIEKKLKTKKIKYKPFFKDNVFYVEMAL